MNVRCPECTTVFRVDPEKVPLGGVRARCSICGAVIEVEVSAAPTGGAPAVVAAATGPTTSTGVAGSDAPSGAPLARPAILRVLPPAGLTPPRSSLAMAPPPADPATPSTVPPAQPRPSTGRHVNPFLATDPDAKARRLARALVSDMSAYQPQKREEGLRNGTLKVLFRDEIKKSYEEYVDHVGREFAESTTHFQAALNDILAGGQRLFS